jgi:hypothetical protein
VSSMEITTEPFAKRAIFPVSKAMERPPISNSSRKLSSTFRPGAGGAAAASAAASSAAPERNAARAPGTARGAAGKRRRGRRRARERREAATAIDMVAGGERGGAGEGFWLGFKRKKWLGLAVCDRVVCLPADHGPPVSWRQRRSFSGLLSFPAV